jgi:hypothetical protein
METCVGPPRKDSQVEIKPHKTDVIPNRAESPVRNLLFAADDLNPPATRPPKTATDGAASVAVMRGRARPLSALLRGFVIFLSRAESRSPQVHARRPQLVENLPRAFVVNGARQQP